jgi:hypothetical protein
MSLYTKLKPYLPEAKNIISDNECLLLNRRDFHISQISSVNATLRCLGINVGYPYRVLMSFLEQISCGLIRSDFNIIISDPSMAVAGFYCWMRSGGSNTVGEVYAPKGLGKFPPVSGLLGEMLGEFEGKVKKDAASRPEGERRKIYTLVLGNTKNSSQTIFAADRYAEIDVGCLVLKDYGRIDAADEREYLESKLIFPSVTFEGHAFSLK